MQSTLSQLLVAEHDIILKATMRILSMGTRWESNPTEYHIEAVKMLDFLSLYADTFHHHKEEEIVFPALSRKNDLVGAGIIPELTEHHEDFRMMTQHIRQKLDSHDYALVQKYFEVYIRKLKEHIAVENDELFPMAETMFTRLELDNLYYQCLDKDRELGNKLKEELESNMQNQVRNEPVQ